MVRVVSTLPTLSVDQYWIATVPCWLRLKVTLLPLVVTVAAEPILYETLATPLPPASVALIVTCGLVLLHPAGGVDGRV